MSDDNRSFDPFQTLADHAEHLNAICSPAWRPKVDYELMSGSLVWSDETNRHTPIEVIWALRFIFAYRTGLILNKPREEFKAIWDHARSLFPKWVGFRAERSQPTAELLDIYRAGDVSCSKCSRDLMRLVETEDTGPRDNDNQ
jgi:hypothetical protein